MLRIRLVGGLRLDLDGRSLETIASRRARSLLAWLAYHPGLHPRTRVAAVFWPDVLDSSARASLRTTLAMLRRELGVVAAGHIVAGRDRVGIEDGPEVWIDAREIDRLAGHGRLEEALALSHGDLLADLDDDWVIEERRRHRDRVAEILALLGEATERTGDLATAVGHARRRLELDPVSEDAARVLIRRLALTGDNAAAVAAYEAFRSALRRELGMAPSAETRALAEDLRADRRVSPTEEPRADRRAPAADARSRPLPPALVRREQAPLVGRREQLAALRAAWRRASAGAASVVTVAGPAGSGKTRLLGELAETAHGEGATVLAGRCTEDGIVAFAPFTEALREHVAQSAATLPEWVVTELARLLPELVTGAAQPEGDPRDARHRLFEAVAATIGDAARRTPVLLVLEDLHWADAATLAMLAHVVRTVAWAPLLVAGSLREEDAVAGPELHALLGDLRRERRLEPVVLGGLSEDEVGELVGAWLRNSSSPSAFAAAVRRRTGGNPLFVEELVQHLVESRPGCSAEELVAAAGIEVPQGVREVIDRRVARLPEPAPEAMRVAAAAGEEFELADLATASSLSEEVIAEALDAAVGAGLVEESSVAGRYRFAHALVREALVAGLSATRRALLHRRLAEALEALPEDLRKRRMPELARHLLDARPLVDARKTATVALEASAQLTRSLAYEEAAGQLARAAELLGEPGRLRAELLLALGEARLRSGDARAADGCFQAAAELARALGENDMLARAALGTAGLSVIVGPVRAGVRTLLEEALDRVAESSPLRPLLFARLAIEVYYVRPTTLRERLSAEALAAGRQSGGRALLEALGARHVALWSPDHVEERLAIADELIAAARSLGDREAELQGVNWRVVDLLELGALEEALAAIAEHERLAGELRLLAYAWYVPVWRAMLAMIAGRLDEAERLSSEGERIGRAARDENAELLFEIQGMAIRRARGGLTDADRAVIGRRAEQRPPGAAWRTWLGLIALAEGDVERARGTLASEVADLESLPLDANWLYTVYVLGLLAAHLGEGAAAAELYPRLMPYGDRMVVVGRASQCAGAVSYSLGLMAAALGDEQAAIAHLERAVRRTEEIGAVPYAAAARYALAGLLPDRMRAEALLREALTAADAVGMALPDGILWRL